MADAAPDTSADVAAARPSIVSGEDGKARCWWPGADPLYMAYHDREWGRPVADDTRLFEKLCLEGFQSGLSWLTILRKRENFRAAFAGFDIDRVAGFGDDDIARLLADPGIVRHGGKIRSTINNARRAQELRAETGSLAAFFWSFEPRAGERARLASRHEIPARTDASIALSKALLKRGWTFVGPTTAYAFMQAMGLVDDHIEGCHCCAAIDVERRAFRRPVLTAPLRDLPGKKMRHSEKR